MPSRNALVLLSLLVGCRSGADSGAPEKDKPARSLRAALRQKGFEPGTLQRLKRQGEKDAYALSVPLKDCARLWRDFRSQAAETGYYPLLMEHLVKFDPGMQEIFAKYPMQHVLQSGLRLNVEGHLHDMIGDPDYPKIADYRGPWPDTAGHRSKRWRDRSLAILDLIELRDGRDAKSVFLVFLPVKYSWQVAAYLVMGGWNACPEPEIHVGMFKYWHDKYGADIVVFGGDYYEFHVARPPSDREAAMALALEQFYFCYDIVDQGTQTLEKLAAELLSAPRWFFWWD